MQASAASGPRKNLGESAKSGSKKDRQVADAGNGRKRLLRKRTGRYQKRVNENGGAKAPKNSGKGGIAPKKGDGDYVRSIAIFSPRRVLVTVTFEQAGETHCTRVPMKCSSRKRNRQKRQDFDLNVTDRSKSVALGHGAPSCLKVMIGNRKTLETGAAAPRPWRRRKKLPPSSRTRSAC